MQFYLLEIKTEDHTFTAIYHPSIDADLEEFETRVRQVVQTHFGCDVEMTFKKDDNNEYVRASKYYELLKNVVLGDYAKFN